MEHLDNDPEAIEGALRVLIAPGEVFEIRALHTSKWRGMIGYFDDAETAARAVANLSEDYAGIYVTLNPLLPDLLYRVNNCFTKFVEGIGTKDHEVTGRNWLPLDFDPVRPTGISSTKAEQRMALDLAKTVADTLELTYGIPSESAVYGSSGNGAHLLYPISMPNNIDVRDTIKEFIRTVSLTHSTNRVTIDHTVFNASRIWRLYGTVARKGSDAEERPHRLSKILWTPPEREPVPFKLIREVARSSLASPAKMTEKRKATPYPADEARWRELNRIAMKRLDEWVPAAFGDDAREYQEGYRISSEALGRDREEDLSIQPLPIGIVDFGEHDSDEETLSGHRTPVSVLAEHIYSNDKTNAAKWLAEALEVKESEFQGLAEKYARSDDDGEEDEFLEEEVKDDANHIKGFDVRSIRSAGAISTKVFKPRSYLVDKLLPRGAYCLISRPKMGKSFLTLQLAKAASKGGHFLGNKVEKCKVLMLLLEEQDNRFQGRLKLLNGGVTPDPEDLANLMVITLDALVDNPFPKGELGCQVLRKIVAQDPDIGLIIIDTFSLFRDHDADYGGGVYDKDYAAVMPIIRMASELGISVICVHHERKGATVAGKADVDFMESASGSAGLTAAFEGVMRIEGHRTEEAEEDDLEEDGVEKPDQPMLTRKLKISGRDIEKDVIVRNISFDPKQGGWYRTGKLNVENAIVNAIRSSLSLTQTELCTLLPSIARNEIKRKLIELEQENILVKTNYNYTLEYAGDAEAVPDSLILSATSATDLTLKLIEWRGTTPVSFLYEVIKGFSPATIRTSLVNLTSGGHIKREERGTYKITRKGSLRLAEARNAAKDDDDASDLL